MAEIPESPADRGARDAIAWLLEELERDGRASFEWVVAHSALGRDPLANAWAESRAGDAMLTLLRAVYSEDLLYVRTGFRVSRGTGEVVQDDFRRGYLRAWMCDADGVYEGAASLADAVRHAVPTPPALEVLTEARDRLRALRRVPAPPRLARKP